MGETASDWAAINADPRFRALRRRKTRFLGLLVAGLLAGYFLPLIAAVWQPDLLRRQVAGAVNVGLLLALAEFPLVWLVAAVYVRRANREFAHEADAVRRAVVAAADVAGSRRC